MKNFAKVGTILIAIFHSGESRSDDRSNAARLLTEVGGTKGPIVEKMVKDAIPVVFTDIGNDNSLEAKMNLAYGTDPDAVKKLESMERDSISNNMNVSQGFKDSFLGASISKAKGFTENVAEYVNSWNLFMNKGGEMTMPLLSATSSSDIQDQGPDEKRTIDKQPVRKAAQVRQQYNQPDYMPHNQDQNDQQNAQMNALVGQILTGVASQVLNNAMNNNSTGYNPNAGTNNRVRVKNNSRNNSYTTPQRTCDPRAVDVSTNTPVPGCY